MFGRMERTMKIDPLDKLVSHCRKLLAEGKCEFCGKYPSSMGYHVHHYVGRRYLNTRYELDNVAALCLGCHNLMHDFSKVEQDFFGQKIGSKRMEELEIIARTQHKMTKERREVIKQDLKDRIKVLEIDNGAKD